MLCTYYKGWDEPRNTEHKQQAGPNGPENNYNTYYVYRDYKGYTWKNVQGGGRHCAAGVGRKHHERR